MPQAHDGTSRNSEYWQTHGWGGIAPVIEEAIAECCTIEMCSMNIQFANTIVDIVPQTDILGSRTTALILISWNVSADGTEGTVAIPDNCLTGTFSFNYLHADVIILRTCFPKVSNPAPIEVIQTTSGRSRCTAIAPNCTSWRESM